MLEASLEAIVQDVAVAGEGWLVFCFWRAGGGYNGGDLLRGCVGHGIVLLVSTSGKAFLLHSYSWTPMQPGLRLGVDGIFNVPGVAHDAMASSPCR